MSKTERIQIEKPFRPRARLLQLVGDQLIGTPRLAVFELVKNGYDADATTVTVTLTGLTKSAPVISIQDDGDGMTLQTIENVWLVPAHDHRANQRVAGRRTRRNRLPLGEKGLGRFAVHKLGERIELVTRAKDSPECVVEIDWRELMKREFLSEAPVTVFARTPEVFTGRRTGTKLVISELRQKIWSRGDVRRLLRQITSISSPFSERSDRFEARLLVPEHPEWIEGIPDVAQMLTRAPWHYRFTFDDKGFRWEYQFRKIPKIKVEERHKKDSDSPLQLANDPDVDSLGRDLRSKEQRQRKVVATPHMLENLGPVSGEFYVFDRDREVLANIGDSFLIQDFLNENGGIRVYRDGIRVYNYGETGDDWLGLDLRRINAPSLKISRNIIVGAIDLSLEKSGGLIEKTNREGFVENDVYARLREIVIGALSVFEVERGEDKEKIRSLTGKGTDAEQDRIKKPLDDLRAVARKYHLEDEFDKYIRRIETDYNDVRETMLRAGLSGLGLAVVFHEVEHGVRILYESLEAGVDVAQVKTQTKELVGVLDGFSQLLRRGEKKTHGLRHLLKEARDINRVRFRAHNIRLVCPHLESEGSDFYGSFSFGLVLGAINNILDNAIYWMKVRWPEANARPSPRAIYMDVSTEFEEGPAVVIADTGPGFQDDPERLTRPFFSRRPNGMGLGLYYANLVMELNSGRLVFPDAGDVEVPPSFDGAVVALVLKEGSI